MGATLILARANQIRPGEPSSELDTLPVPVSAVSVEFHFDLSGRLTHETDRLLQHCDEVGERG